MSKHSDLHIADVREVEPPRVRHLLIYYFLQGIALSAFFVVANSLFLSSFVAADLPMAYVGSAIVLLILGKVYDLVEQRVAMYKRAALLILIALSVIAFYAGTVMFSAMWLPFLMFVWCRVIFTIAELEFFGLSNLLFETRDSKSLFGWINMREVPGKVIGYFSVGLLLPIIELPILLLISGAAFFINFFFLRKLLDPRYAREVPVEVNRKPKERVPFSQMPGAALLLLLCVLGFVGVAIFALVNFSFLSLLEDKFHKASELATYLGLVFGIANALILVGKVFLTNKVMSRIGAKAAMLALPLFVIAIALLLAARGTSEESFLIFFVVMLAGSKVLRETLYEPIFITLAQPLPGSVRQRSYTFIKTLAEPLGLAACGVLIYVVLGHAPHPDLFKATYIIIGLAIVWAALVLVTFGKYVVAFKSAIAQKVLVTRAVDSFNSFSQSIMREKMESKLPEEVIYAHEICSNSNLHFFETEIGRLLRHESEEVRLYALRKMDITAAFTDTDILLHLGNNDTSIEVRQLAIAHCGSRYRDTFADQYNLFLEHPDQRIRQAAIKGLMDSGNPEIIMIAGHKLNDLIAARGASQNVSAAAIIGDMRLNSHYNHLLNFFAHSDINVRKAAITSAGVLAHPKLMAPLFPLLADRKQSAEVVMALGHYKADVVAYLLENKEWIERYPADILSLCSYIEEKIAAMLICQYLLPIAETSLLDDCLQALYKMETDKVEVDRGVLELKLINIGSFIYSCLHYHKQLSDDAFILKDALAAEIKNARRRLLLLLSLMYARKAFGKIIAAYDKVGGNKAAVVQMLDAAFDDNHKKRFLPIFELSGNDELIAHMAQFYPLLVKDDVSEAILVGAKSRFLLWTQAAALYTYLLELSDEVLLRYKDHYEPMIFEMVQLALSRKPFVLRLIGDDSHSNFVYDPTDVDGLLNIEKIVMLKSIPIFLEFTQPMLTAICNIMTEQRFSANSMVYSEGEPGSIMYIIYYGTVSMYNGVQEIMQQGGREILVKIDSADQKLASAKAVTDTLLFRINKESIDAINDRYPEIAQSMLKMFSVI